MIPAGNPRLRAVEAFPVEHEGQRCLALRDPAGFTDQIAVLPGALLDLVSLFDDFAGFRRPHVHGPQWQ